ncbi:MAG TPA: hypothetical protein VM686_28360, partial [Polyangiaceae bacterium]|nr:hypothetical protein [Polyangiaceae bacterium]
ATDLVGPSTTTPTRSVGEEALARIRATGTQHMPPAPIAPLSAAELAAFESWVNAGMPAGSCGSTSAPAANPYDTPVVCTSDRHWAGGDEESPAMYPGRACISCHEREDEGPRLAIAGTLYPTPHEPDDCNGASQTSADGVRVVVTDAGGNEHRLTPNAAGNFFIEAERFAFPYTAKVEYDGRERVMLGPQSDGDCNGCHTEAGKNDAPGRILLP